MGLGPIPPGKVKPATPVLQTGQSLSRKLAFYLPMADGGGDLRDYSGNGHHGVATSAVDRAIGRSGKGRHMAESLSLPVVMGPNSDFSSDGNATFCVIYEKADATSRNAGLFGSAVTGSPRMGVATTSSDTVIWEYGGQAEGFQRLSVTNQTFEHAVWVYTVGSRGMEIWKDGVLIASNSATPTRPTNSVNWGLGRHASDNSDNLNYYLFAGWDRQLHGAEIKALAIDPFGLVRQDWRSVAGAEAGLAIVRVVNEVMEVDEDPTDSGGPVATLFQPTVVVNEVEQVVETLVRPMVLVRVLDESASLVEDLVRSRIMSRVLDESVSLVEAVEQHRDIRQLINEVEELGETTLRAMVLVRTFIETVEIPEIIVRPMVLVRVLSEVAEIPEIIVRPLALTRVINEVEEVPETTVRRLTISTGQPGPIPNHDLSFAQLPNHDVPLALLPSHDILLVTANSDVTLPTLNSTVTL